MIPKIKLYQQEKNQYSNCEYIDYDYMRLCIETSYS